MSTKTQIIYGIRPVIEALNSDTEVDKILIQNGLQGANVSELKMVLKEKNIPFQFVPVEKLNKLTTSNHQGVVAFVSLISYQSVENLIPQLFEEKGTAFLIMLDRITDVRNLGAIARTAECAGVDGIIIPAQGNAQINEDAIKTSAGALYKIPVCKEKNLKTVINLAKQSGLQVCGATEKAAKNYTECDFTKPTLLIMGSEENGISPEYLKLCDETLKLPILGEVKSLNVSVAAGIFIYEKLRQTSHL